MTKAGEINPGLQLANSGYPEIKVVDGRTVSITAPLSLSGPCQSSLKV
jgi:hypothetical protein